MTNGTFYAGYNWGSEVSKWTTFRRSRWWRIGRLAATDRPGNRDDIRTRQCQPTPSPICTFRWEVPWNIVANQSTSARVQSYIQWRAPFGAHRLYLSIGIKGAELNRKQVSNWWPEADCINFSKFKIIFLFLFIVLYGHLLLTLHGDLSSHDISS